MPRRPRLELPGRPLHVTHRGVNRAAVFLDEDDPEQNRGRSGLSQFYFDFRGRPDVSRTVWRFALYDG